MPESPAPSANAKASTSAEGSMGLPPPPPLRLPTTALFADLDGTLARIEDHPLDVVPDEARTALLEALSVALSGRLAVVSGRSLEDLDRVLSSRVRPLAGVHGLARRAADGSVTVAPAHPGLAQARDDLQPLVARHPGLWLEDKGHALALHYRAAPQWKAAATAAASRAASRHGLTLQNGSMVAELRTPGPDKGGAVEAFMAEPPFAGATPVFIGDDLTDEHGFAAATRLGGYGVLVGDRRPTQARYALADVEAAHDWLARSLRT